jgi:hypothetical protein
MLLLRANFKINMSQLEGGQDVSDIEIKGYEINCNNPKAQKPIANHHRSKCAPVVTAINMSFIFIETQRGLTAMQ